MAAGKRRNGRVASFLNPPTRGPLRGCGLRRPPSEGGTGGKGKGEAALRARVRPLGCAVGGGGAEGQRGAPSDARGERPARPRDPALPLRESGMRGGV